jgi:hypothetical protein
MRNIVRIIIETGLRVYKELMPMKKQNLDLENAVVWIPDSKTPQRNSGGAFNADRRRSVSRPTSPLSVQSVSFSE